MSREAKKPTSESRVPSSNAALFVFGTIADTTWRIFVPVLLGAGVGLWLDNTNGTEPAAALSGTLIGTIISGGLIYQQIKRDIK